MNLIFFGTSDYCLPVLDALHQNFSLKLVVTRPDKPIGRRKLLTPAATKVWANEHKIASITPETLKKDTQDRNLVISRLDNLQIDLAIVSDFGLIIPEAIFNLPKLGTLNIHFSHLPDLRGPSPVQNTLLRGDTVAWVTIFKLDNPPSLDIKMDSGPILWQKSYSIHPDDTTQTLYSRLFQEVAKELPEILLKYQQPAISSQQLTVQDHSRATFCRFLTKEDGFVGMDVLQMAQNGAKISLSDLPEIQQQALKSILGNENYGDLDSAQNLYNFFRAVTPWPGMWTLNEEKRMKILKCHLKINKLILDEVQFEGKKPQFLNVS